MTSCGAWRVRVGGWDRAGATAWHLNKFFEDAVWRWADCGCGQGAGGTGGGFSDGGTGQFLF
jgi:hypothetical protein